MVAAPSRSAALEPTFTVLAEAALEPSGERGAHPAGRGRPGIGLPTNALEEIATGLARTVAPTGHRWIDGNRRRYTQLLGNDIYDAWLISWSASSSLELHDHGGSEGVIALASGTLVETYTDIVGRHPIRTRILRPPNTLVIPPSRVHEVSNPGPRDALSVHVYSPPLKSMTFYDLRPDRFLHPLSSAEGDLAGLEERS